MQLVLCNLEGGDAQAMYKPVSLDLLSYKRIQMDIHEHPNQPVDINNMNMSVFIRLGSDYTDNYYEYEIPLFLLILQRYPMEMIKNGSDMMRQLVWILITKRSLRI